MENEKLPPIPTPLSQRWREFRIQILPFMVFIATLVAIVYLWRTIVQPTGMVGFVETNQVNVASLQDGLIAELYVDRFQMVKKDQPICVVANTDPDLISATIEAAKAELLVTSARGVVDLGQGQLRLQQLINDLFTQKTTQAARRAELVYAETNLTATAELLKKEIVGKLQYDAVLAKRDSLRDEIDARDKYMVDLQKSLEVFKTSAEDPIAKSVLNAIAAKQKELELSLKPTLLKAPFDGMITMVYHRAGEKVLRGLPIISIASTNAVSVVGYVRQPLQRKPQVGDAVRVTTRGTPRRYAQSHIIKVGAQLEPLNPALLSADTKRMEVGLPIVVECPPILALTPGEFVDIAYDR